MNIDRTEQVLSVKMRITLAVTILLASFFTIYCKFNKREIAKTPMETCVDQLMRIPAVAALRKSQSPENAETSRPLDGMEIALTLDKMIRSNSNPDDDIDSWCEYENSADNLDKIIRALKEHQMPPTVDFVIGKALDKTMIERWLQNGNLIGNMTYSRMRASKRDAQEFFEDVMLNDRTLAPLLEKYPAKQKYFRYPGLAVSKDAQSREQVRSLLRDSGYLEAMATIDIPDGQFSEVYCAAQARGDEICANFIKANYKRVLLDMTLRTQAAAKKKTGNEVKMILNLNMNQFTCDYLGEIIRWYKNLGARFISLDEALRDPLYTTFDGKGRPLAQTLIREARRAQIGDVQMQ